MKVKVYRVYYKKDPETEFFVDAPNKRIAKWCGANLVNHERVSFLTAKDMVAERFKVE